MVQVGIFVGTVYGNALLVAEAAEIILRQQGHEVNLFEEGTDELEFYRQHYALIITSTTGQGDLPDNIASLFNALRDKSGYQPELRYGVIALGDGSYENFCGAGRKFDDLLQEQGATRMGDRLEIDALEHPAPEIVARQWIEKWCELLG